MRSAAFAIFVDQAPGDFVGALDQVLRQLIELLAFDLVGLAAAAVLDDEGRLGADGEAALALLDFPGQVLQALGIASRIVAEFAGELFGDGGHVGTGSSRCPPDAGRPCWQSP